MEEYRMYLMFIMLMAFISVIHTRTILNVATKTRGATCTASSVISSTFPCDKALQPGGAWLTKQSIGCEYITSESLKVNLPTPIDVAEFGSRYADSYNIPQKMFVTFGSSANSAQTLHQFNLVSSNKKMQKFRVKDSFGKNTVIKQVDWVDIHLVIDNSTLGCSACTGIYELHIGAIFDDVPTETGKTCSFPFTYNGNIHDECVNGPGGDLICNTTSGLTDRCVLPVVAGCDKVTASTPNVGPRGVSKVWCQGQGGCYRADRTCKRTHHCPPDYFGSDCEHRCNCKNPLGGCDIASGRNNSCICKDGHYPVGDSCKPGSLPTVLLTNKPGNPGMASTFTCTNQAIPTPTTSLHSVGARKQITQLASNIKASQTVTTTYSVNDVQQGQEFLCIAKNAKGEKTQRHTASMYSLPVLSFAPDAPHNLVQSHDLMLKWLPFLENRTGSGDGPVIRYVVLMGTGKPADDTEWSEVATVDAADNEKTFHYQHHVQSLLASNQYSFSIACVRPGTGGQGPPGPSLTITTLPDTSANTSLQTKPAKDLTTKQHVSGPEAANKSGVTIVVINIKDRQRKRKQATERVTMKEVEGTERLDKDQEYDDIIL